MKKIYSFVLMAAALLISANSWAVTRPAANATDFENAWKAAANGDVIQLTANVTISKTFWLGTVAMNDEPKSITLDLNGKTLTAPSSLSKMFFISHGELNVITSLAGGKIIHQGSSNSSSFEMFRVAGSTYKNVNPKTAESGFYSHLIIGEGVELQAKANAVVIDRMDGWVASAVNTLGITTPSALPYNANVYKTDRGVANGARVDMYGTVYAHKYCIKANGNMGNHNTAATARSGYFSDPEHTVAYVNAGASDDQYSPFIHIHPSAYLETLDVDQTYSIAAYSGGYSRWLVEGTCIGSTGVYVKSGELVINNATIASNYTGTYEPAGEEGEGKERKSGVDAAGSGIVMESTKTYAGGIDVTVQGDTKVTATSGYAIDENVTADAGNTAVDAITITGGTLESGQQGAIKVTEITAEAAADPAAETAITVVGGEMTSGAANIGDQTLADFLADQSASSENKTHITYVENEAGKTVMVISEGEAPSVPAEGMGNSVIGADANSSISWVQPNEALREETLVADLSLKELEINQAYIQKLNIPNGITLTAERVVLGKNARIVVEAGGKLIVTGAQGIVAPSVNNILLKNEGALVAADRKHAIFLFNPNVTSNKHPNATVELTTYSYADGAAYQWERFGVPSHNALKSISSDAQTAFQTYDNGWQSLGYLNVSGQPDVNPSDFNKPFATYALLANRKLAAAAPTYQFAGELVGNGNAELNVNLYWTPFTNSYSAEINVPALFAEVKKASIIDEWIYIAKPGGLGTYTWDPVDDETKGFNSMKLAPMQAFILKKVYGSVQTEKVGMNYASMVYGPATKPAPARRVAADHSAYFRVVIENENGVWDNVKFRETTLTKEAEKYMNDDVNIYAMTAGKSAIVAAEDLENSYIGVSTVKGGNMTISFADVEGREFDLVDTETGAVVPVMEGATYQFHLNQNAVADYRFKVVERNNAPTAIENAEAVKSAKGIYTITGQYVGEMNVWNTLPAGVYVVDGAKRVK